jgi:hypothetical protein
MIKRLFKAHGITVTQPKSRGTFDHHKVLSVYDGVPYCMDPTNEFDAISESKIPHIARHFELMKERHHTEIKAICEHLKQFPEIGDFYVMAGGGSQLQAFFGNAEGYLAILYLTHEDGKKPRGKYICDVQWIRNYKYFKTMEVAGVKVRK